MTKRKKTTPTFGEQIAQHILENYDFKGAQDIQDALQESVACPSAYKQGH